MSQRPISRSPDLKRLADEGYEIEIREGFLLLHQVPYLDSQTRVRRGTLVSTLQLADDQAVPPTQDHTVHFTGTAPHDHNGNPIDIIASGGQRLFEGLTSRHLFSHKPTTGYPDYYEKMATYVHILSGPVQAVDPAATAITHGVVETDEDSVFEYMETASSRAGVSIATAKLRGRKVAIVGLGGTGAYELDLVAKTPVAEMHLYDGDVFYQHNAFRSPGAATTTELRARIPKVEYYKARYSSMRRGIVAHAVYVDETNVGELAEMDFVFVSIDDGAARRLIVEALHASGVPFADVGMGVYSANDSLGGQIRVTTATPDKCAHIADRVPFAEAGDPANQYATNVQISDLNMLNAALAVIKWKKLCGFYVDLDGEHHSVYEIDGNFIHNEDTAYDDGGPEEAGMPQGAEIVVIDGTSNKADGDDGTEQAAA
jgi:molybdopterin/thiamine biosynthesis adenylyltransferase